MEGTVIGSLHFWLRLSLALLSLLSLSLRLLSSGAKPNATDATNTAPLHRAGKLTSPLIFALLWFTAGCTFMDYQLHRNSFERKNLDVTEVYPAGNVQMTERIGGQVLYVNPCPESPTKFWPGMHIRKIQYAQMAGCKIVKFLDYDVRPDGRIQIGEIADAR